jgi:DNA-binding phage protein
MVKDNEVKKRLLSLNSKELTSDNLANAVLFDMPKLLKKQKDNYQATVTYEIVQTPTGYWAKIYIAGNPNQFRVNLKKVNDKYYVNYHWLEKIADENSITLYQIAKNAKIDRTVLYRIVKRDSAFDNVQITTHKAIANGLGIPFEDYFNKYGIKK